jgi:hypothetical protein
MPACETGRSGSAPPEEPEVEDCFLRLGEGVVVERIVIGKGHCASGRHQTGGRNRLLWY